MSTSSTVHDLKSLVLSFHPLIAVETVEEERVVSLLESVASDTGLPLFEWSVTRGLARVQGTSRIHGTQEPAQLLRHIELMTVDALFLLKDFCKHLEDPAVIRQFRETVAQLSGRPSTLVLVGESMRLPAEVEHVAVHYDLQLPERNELKEVLVSVLRSVRTKNINIDLDPNGVEDLLTALRGMTLNQARQMIAYVVLEDGCLSRDDIQVVLGRKAQMIRESGLLEYFPADDNRYELGGFQNLKSWLERAEVGFSPEARKLNLIPPKGILLVGVQGCGKSLAARFIARSWKLPLLKMDPGQLFDKYVGESEKNFRKAIALAESMAPAVLWIDEIEKAFAGLKSDSADGGLGRRLFGSFLTWLQEKGQDVFVIATANDLDSLPPELLRKGRFDEIFFVDLPDPRERENIFRIHLKLRKQDPVDFSLPELVEATRGFSGAEIEQAVIASLYRALHIRKKLSTELLIQEIGDTVPLSVSRREDIESFRSYARERFVNVGQEDGLEAALPAGRPSPDGLRSGLRSSTP